MQVTCPNCSQAVPAANINIQELVGVCPSCDQIFPVTTPTAKAKRRKVKQPEPMAVHDADALEIAFHTNFRLDKDQAVQGAAVMFILSTVFTFVFLSEFWAGELSVFMPLLFALGSLWSGYALALRLYNRTHIHVQNDTVRISRQPLPNPLAHTNEVSLHAVTAILAEETEISKEQAYDTPRYNVWAETADGARRPIINDVTEQYAYFIAQRLSERLHKDAPPPRDTSRLSDLEAESNDDSELADDWRPDQTAGSF